LFIIQKRIGKFSAAHRIQGHPKCSFLHGHDFHVSIEIEYTEYLPSSGLVLDFALFAPLKDALLRYDHRTLLDFNDPLFLELHDSSVRTSLVQFAYPPTTECIAQRLFAEFKGLLWQRISRTVRLKSVTVLEGDGDGATFRE